MAATALKTGIAAKYIAPLVVSYSIAASALAGASGFELSALAQHFAAGSIVGLAVLTLQELPPPWLKEALVHWRLKHRLPGFRAFTVFAKRDPRFEYKRLEAIAGSLPTKPAAQNALWHQWLKQTEGAAEVDEVHRRYLILRDAAFACALLAIATPLLLFLPQSTAGSVLCLGAICFIAYLLLALAAQSVSARFVSTVIAVWMVKR